MNRPLLRTTNAAEGMPRRAFTVAELEQMVAAGIIDHHERIELIGGDVVAMAPKGLPHEELKSALSLYWARRMPDTLSFTIATTFQFTSDTYLEPDFVFYPKGGLRELSAKSARLVIEVADSSLSYDRGRKAGLYAGFGIVELWVIDAAKLETRIHTEPTVTGYRRIVDLPPGERLVPTLVPALAVTLAELDLR